MPLVDAVAMKTVMIISYVRVEKNIYNIRVEKKIYITITIRVRPCRTEVRRRSNGCAYILDYDVRRENNILLHTAPRTI